MVLKEIYLQKDVFPVGIVVCIYKYEKEVLTRQKMGIEKPKHLPFRSHT